MGTPGIVSAAQQSNRSLHSSHCGAGRPLPHPTLTPKPLPGPVPGTGGFRKLTVKEALDTIVPGKKRIKLFKQSKGNSKDCNEWKDSIIRIGNTC